MTCYPAKVTGAGEVTIYGKDKDGKNIDFIIKYDSKQMNVAIEKIKLETAEDEGVLNNWGDIIHRINFNALTPKRMDTFKFEVKKKEKN
jgi:hypothetical protein